MREVLKTVQQMHELMVEISHAGREQRAGIEQVNKAVSQMDTVTQQNAGLVEEAATAAQSLHEQAEALDHLVSVFKLEEAARRPSSGSRALVVG
jgi:methyl-accepting chemotaxis protein